jgi:hypothetical protein
MLRPSDVLPTSGTCVIVAAAHALPRDVSTYLTELTP